MKRSWLAALVAISLVRCSKPEGTTGTSVSSSTVSSSAPSPALSASASANAPKTPLEQRLDAIEAVRRFKEVAISPDGLKLAWVESFAAPGSDAPTLAVRVLRHTEPAATPRTITAGASAKKERGITWSPDGKVLAFLSDAPGKDGTQLFVADPNDSQNPPRKLTSLRGGLDAPRYSPDGRMIAVLVAEPPATGGAPHGVAPVREQKEAPVPRVVLVDAVTGEAHPLTRADLYVHEYAWSPDGGRLAVIGSPPPALRWYNSKIYVVDARSGAERALMTPPQQIAAPCWSPDGRSIAFISGLMSDESDTAGDVYLTSADGSSAGRNLTPGFHGSARSLAWPTGDRVVLSASVDGGSAIATVDANAKLDLLWSDATEAAGVPAFSADGKVTALARESITAAPELWAGPLGDWKQVTHTNDGIRATWGAARSVHWKSDGATVQGWLVAPPVVEPQKRGRLVVVVHGGPAAMARPYFAGGLYAPWVDERTYVFCPNPRGSYGQGEAFTAANVKDFGPGPMRDILAGVDEVVRTTPVDGARVGLTGWSYGGFMTMWMVTQTTRFHAAVAGAGIANWQSYRGQIEVPDWMQPYFGKSVYDDPQVYARSSPIEFITRAKTPTLLLVGENDEYCPASQSYEFWRALKAQGVETELVVYPGEGHGLGKSEHRRDRIVRTLRWFDAHL